MKRPPSASTHRHMRAHACAHTADPLCKALTAERDAEIKRVHLYITAQHLTRGLSLLSFCDLFGLRFSVLFTLTKSVFLCVFFVIQLRGCLTGITIRLKIFSSNAVSETSIGSN